MLLASVAGGRQQDRVDVQADVALGAVALEQQQPAEDDDPVAQKPRGGIEGAPRPARPSASTTGGMRDMKACFPQNVQLFGYLKPYTQLEYC